MKTIIAFVFCLSFLSAKAQNLHLEKAGRQLKNGFILSAAGAGIATTSTFLEGENERRQLLVIGLLFTIGGGISTYSGYHNIQKAGQVKETSLSVTPSGIAYRF